MVESEPDAHDESFEAGLQRLAELVAALESGGLGLAESIAAYERGVGILGRLHEELAAAEERVRVLVRIDEQGRPVLAEPAPAAGDAAPETEGATAESPQPAAPRPSRANRAKAARPRQLPGMDGSDPA